MTIPRTCLAAWVLAAIVVAFGSPARAQEVVDSAAVPDSVAPPPAPDTAMWIAVGQRSRSTVVAATITYPVGSANDDEGRGGTAWLLARTWQAMLTDALGPDASATVSVDRSRFRATVVATPDRWETAYETLVTVLNHRDVAADHLEVARARLLGRMTFEAGAPVREFEIEVARLYADGHTDWARPLDGSPESLQAISVRDLEIFRRTHLTGEYAAVAVSGAVGVESAVRTAAALRRGTARRSNPRPAAASPQAWLTGDRRVEARDITNAAVAFAYPLPAHHDRTEAEFLAHVLQESLNSDPPDPSVYRVEAAVTDAPGGPLVIIEATVFPDAGHRWEGLIEDALRAVRSTNPNEDVYFPWRQRRFRSVSMNAEASPEALNSRLNEDLLRDGRQRDLKERIAALSANGLVDLANELGLPHILYFGPDLADRQ